MSDLRPQIRTCMQNLLESNKDGYIASDILRIFHEEATLMKETEETRDALTSDPYENLKGIPSKTFERFKRSLQVTVCDRQRCGVDFARTHAVVAWPAQNNMQLHFLYERQPRRGFTPNNKGYCPCQVSYTIELSYNHGQRQRLLEVQVWATSNVPSPLPAICIQNELEGEEDGWEDIDETEEEAGETDRKNQKDLDNTADSPSLKKQKMGDEEQNSEEMVFDEEKHDEDNDGSNEPDQYIAFLDADVMQNFLESAGLTPMDDGTAFFLLMTFPFFDHEWDIVGYVLDQMFGDGEEDECDE